MFTGRNMSNQNTESQCLWRWTQWDSGKGKRAVHEQGGGGRSMGQDGFGRLWLRDCQWMSSSYSAKNSNRDQQSSATLCCVPELKEHVQIMSYIAVGRVGSLLLSAHGLSVENSDFSHVPYQICIGYPWRGFPCLIVCHLGI